MSTALVAGRYVLEKSIGRGGMAVVHEAVDTVTGRRLALKQLRPRAPDARTERAVELFEREYHMLMELAHPRIVAAVDYGCEGDLPWYTMELLDGGDLIERSPLPWREACAVVRDVCSALSLLHSRRMVYRDLSPRNVRCTSDGKAKLLDFGAMAPMGTAPSAVCTPAVASPEVVYRLPLDARSDLYALGALLYFTLVGRSAYPARSFHHLIDLWRQPLAGPSELKPEIPPALDALVTDLLQLDPQLRPSSAAEVSDRLSAIAGLPASEQLLVAQAYLTTPTLVGRDREIARVQSALAAAKQSRSGAALLVCGAPGMGRSRLLDACVLSAKLAGAVGIRVAPARGGSQPFALARELAHQLLEILPEQTLEAAAPHRAHLLELVPALRDSMPAPAQTSNRPAEGREARVQATLRAFFLDVAERRPLLVAIDDLERFDSESRALVTLLAHRAPHHPLVLLAATDGDDAEGDGLTLLRDACTALELRPLDVQRTHDLLASMFGDVPNLTGLVRRLHALSDGSPQNLMRLAQHLVDRGVVRYEAGGWVLPERVDDADLPATMAQALRTELDALDPDTRSLAQAFAECPEQRFTFDECLELTAHRDAGRTLRSVDQLLSAAVLTVSGDAYALASKSWIGVLSDPLEPAQHRRLAAVFERRGEGLRAARHLLRAGDEREGLDRFVTFAQDSYAQTNSSTEAYVRLLSTLPRDWMAIHEQAIALCAKHDRPAHELRAILVRLGGLLSQNDVCSNGHLAALAQRTARDVGLDIHAELDPKLPPVERLQRALAAAAERHQRTPEHARGLDPKSAIGLLARTLITAIGNFSRTLDVEEWRQLPSVAPLAPLSPAMAMVDRLARGFDARVTGRFESACEIYRETLALIDQGKVAGLDAIFVDSVRSALPSILGMLEAVLALPSCERYAVEVAASPLYEGSALSIRMLHALWLGDVTSADRLSRERELWQLEQSRQQASDVLTLLWAVQAHAASDDLTRTRRGLEAIERIAGRMRTWAPIAAWARGEYERIRGDGDAALEALDRALGAMQPGGHQLWPVAAGARVRVLCEQRRLDQAREAGEQYLAAAAAHGLGYAANYVRMPLAIAAARLGDAEAAWLHANAAIASFEALGARGIHLGLAHEAAAFVASALSDAEAAARHAAACRQSFLAHPNPALAAKYRRLGRDARKRRLVLAREPIADTLGSTMDRSEIESILQTCANAQDRLDRTLQWLVHGSGADHGFLFGWVDGRAVLHAQTPGARLPPELEEAATTWLQRELSGDDDETATATTSVGSSTGDVWTRESGRCYRPLTLSHASGGEFVLNGLVLLGFDCSQVLRPVADSAHHVSRLVTQHGDLPAHVIGR